MRFSLVAALLFLGLVPLRAAEPVPADFLIDVNLSPLAAKKLLSLKEKIIVSVDWGGEPTAKAQKHAGDDGTINLGVEDVTISGAGGRAQITGRPYRRENAEWVEGEVRVNVNVYTARLSDPDNLLDCDHFNEEIFEARAKPVAIFCKLITEM